jgi:hypothetical protein
MILSSKTARKLRHNALNLAKKSKIISRSLKVEKIHKSTSRNGKIINRRRRNAKISKERLSTSKDRANLFADKKGRKFHKEDKNNNLKDRNFSEH